MSESTEPPVETGGAAPPTQLPARTQLAQNIQRATVPSRESGTPACAVSPSPRPRSHPAQPSFAT
eukprot:5488749-Pyramimonas_sp.AAC.1